MEKNNTTEVKGNQNIVIQDVTAENITVNVNGDIQEIKNEFNELKKILQQRDIKTIQKGKNIYNIGQIDEANFAFLTEKRAFNEWLTKKLISELGNQSKSAHKFLEKVKNIPNWESVKRISNKAKEIIAYSFVGVIGIQLRKQMAIGEEAFSEKKQKNYIDNSILTAKRVLELINFTLLSGLWDSQQRNFKELTAEQKKIIELFFNHSFELDVKGLLELLKKLFEIYQQNNIK